jgi:TonB family protein
MTQRTTRRFLIAAFAISLLLHAILAGWIRWPSAPRESQVAIVTIESRAHIARITHAAVPALHTPSPSASKPRAIAHVPAHTELPSKRGTGTTAIATIAPTAAPSPVATGAPCIKTDAPAALAATPPPPDITLEARAQGTSGTARVRVHLDPKGTVLDAKVVGSTGNDSLDAVALTMAKSAQYSPALAACKAVAGDYTFTAKFVAW